MSNIDFLTANIILLLSNAKISFSQEGTTDPQKSIMPLNHFRKTSLRIHLLTPQTMIFLDPLSKTINKLCLMCNGCFIIRHGVQLSQLQCYCMQANSMLT